MNQGRFISRSARYWPDHAAVIFKDRVLTFAALEDRSNRLANALLGLGLRKGDRVAVQSWNRPELIELECALYKAGLVKVALNARLSKVEVQETISNAQARVVIAGPTHIEAVDALRPQLPDVEHFVAIDAAAAGFATYETLLERASSIDPDVDMNDSDLAVLHFTSGSTGKLKAAMQTVGNRMASLRKVVMGRMRAQPGDVLVLAGPITHASGMFIQPFLSQGGTILLHDRFDPDAYLASITRHRATAGFLVPTMINMLVKHPGIAGHDLRSLRHLSYGGAPAAPALIAEAWERLGPVLAQGYGAGETTGGLVTLSVDDHRIAIEQGQTHLLSSCGRPFGESQVLVVDDEGRALPPGDTGEIVVRGPDVFAGYWREPELTAAALRDGRLHTGDLARVDDRGYIYIVDRKKEMIISGGFNVYPTEVEQALYQHPAIYEACVIGVPDETWGEAIKAVVVLRDGCHASADDLIRHCQGLVADFKKPRSVEFVAELPKNGNGKLARKDVKERYWQGQHRRVA